MELESDYSTKATKSFSMPQNFLSRLAVKVLEQNIVKTVYKRTLQGLLDKKTNNEIVEQINFDQILHFFEKRGKETKIKKQRGNNKKLRRFTQ
jgi:hypothetical protein